MNGNDIVSSLVADLRTLRRGRGLDSSLTADRIGPTLAAACGVGADDGAEKARGKVRDRLLRLASSLPEDLRVAVLAAFALERATSRPFYGERLQLAADALGRDKRTVRRRVDLGIERIAEIAAAEMLRSAGGPERPEFALWHTQTLRASLNMALPAPEAFVCRRIVADQDDLRVIDLGATLSAPPEGAPPVGDRMSMDVVYGGTLLSRRIEATNRLGMALELPRPLARGEEHEFAIRLRVAEGGPMRPHFVTVTQQPCEWLEIRVKFDERNRPDNAWLLERVFQDELDDPVHRGREVLIDAAHELCVEFERPAPGFAYGVQWDEGAAGQPSGSG